MARRNGAVKLGGPDNFACTFACPRLQEAQKHFSINGISKESVLATSQTPLLSEVRCIAIMTLDTKTGKSRSCVNLLSVPRRPSLAACLRSPSCRDLREAA